MLRKVQGNPEQYNATMMNWNNSKIFSLSGKPIQRPRIWIAAARRKPLHSRDISANSLDGGLDTTLQSSLTKVQIQGTKFLSDLLRAVFRIQIRSDSLLFGLPGSGYVPVCYDTDPPLLALLWRSRSSELWPVSSSNRYHICSKKTKFDHKYKKYLGSIFILSRRSNRPDSRTGRVEAKRRQR